MSVKTQRFVHLIMAGKCVTSVSQHLKAGKISKQVSAKKRRIGITLRFSSYGGGGNVTQGRSQSASMQEGPAESFDLDDEIPF